MKKLATITLVGAFTVGAATAAMAQQANPCAAKRPAAQERQNPCAAKTPTTAKNPCAAKTPDASAASAAIKSPFERSPLFGSGPQLRGQQAP
jgi:hypothetical protein